MSKQQTTRIADGDVQRQPARRFFQVINSKIPNDIEMTMYNRLTNKLSKLDNL